jgi:hypothetical protein
MIFKYFCCKRCYSVKYKKKNRGSFFFEIGEVLESLNFFSFGDYKFFEFFSYKKQRKMLKSYYQRVESVVYENVIKTNALIPNDFFDVRQETTPKASTFLLYLTSGIGYAIGFAIFITLMVSESKNFITETTIQTKDISDGTYTCSMASVVSKSVTYSSTDTFNSVAAFSQINELKTDCLANLQGICENQQNYVFVPSGQATLKEFDYYPNSVFNGILYVYQSTPREAIRFDLRNGLTEVTTNPPFGGGPIASSKTDGYYYSSSERCIYSFNSKKSIGCLDPSLALNVTAGVINDDQGNVYFKYYFDSSPYADNDIVLIIQTLSGSKIVQYTFRDGAGYDDISFLRYISNNEWELFIIHEKQIRISSSNSPNTFTGEFDFDTYPDVLGVTSKGKKVIYYMEDTHTVFSLIVPSKTITKLFSIPDAGPIYDINEVLLIDEDGIFWTVRNGEEKTIIHLYLYNITTNVTIEFFPSRDGSRIGWFACNNRVTHVLPLDPNSLQSYCENNGIMWTYTMNSGLTGLLSNEQTKTIIKQEADEICPDVISSICSTVGNLPPYICTKNVYPSFSLVLSSAFANTNALLTTLFLIFGILLPKLNDWMSSEEKRKVVPELVVPDLVEVNKLDTPHDDEELHDLEGSFKSEASLNSAEFAEIISKY